MCGSRPGSVMRPVRTSIRRGIITMRPLVNIRTNPWWRRRVTTTRRRPPQPRAVPSSRCSTKMVKVYVVSYFFCRSFCLELLWLVVVGFFFRSLFSFVPIPFPILPSFLQSLLFLVFVSLSFFLRLTFTLNLSVCVSLLPSRALYLLYSLP